MNKKKAKVSLVVLAAGYRFVCIYGNHRYRQDGYRRYDGISFWAWTFPVVSALPIRLSEMKSRLQRT